MAIEDKDILHKIIELQSCIIQGRNIKTLLHTNTDFYINKSGANIIAIHIHEEEHMNIDYIIEEHRNFSHLVKKYLIDKKDFKWDTFIKNCDKHFGSKIGHDMITDLNQVFRGFLSKKDAQNFAKELHMKSAIMMPMYCYDTKRILGYVCYFFQSETDFDLRKLEEIKTSFQTLLLPLYDREHTTFFTKCVRIDEDMKLLTSKEKKIVKRVLEGMSYPEVADILDLSINTVKTHMKNIFNKYNVSSKIELYNKLNAYTV